LTEQTRAVRVRGVGRAVTLTRQRGSFVGCREPEAG